MHLIVDAHEDLAWNALTFGRDYTRSALDTRQAELKTETPWRNGNTLLGLPEYLQGQVAVVFGTLFVAPARSSAALALKRPIADRRRGSLDSSDHRS